MILLPSALCIELLKNKFTWLGQGRGVSSFIEYLVKNIEAEAEVMTIISQFPQDLIFAKSAAL